MDHEQLYLKKLQLLHVGLVHGEFAQSQQRFKLRQDDLESVLKPLLFFGKLIGLVQFKKFRFAGLIAIIMLINVGAEIIGLPKSEEIKKSPFDVAATLGVSFFYTLGLFMYTYMYVKNRHINTVIQVWRRTSLPHFEVDKKLYRDVNLMAFLVFFSAIPENIVYHLRACMGANSPPFLSCTFSTMHVTWPRLVPYHPLVSVYLILTNKLALYAWNFMDVLIAMLCRALAFRFRSLSRKPATPYMWSTLRRDYNLIVEAFEVMHAFLSPMIFASFAINTYALCMQLNMWLTPSKNVTIWDNVYTLWSSLHLVARVLLVAINAANVHDSALRVHQMIPKCPLSDYTPELVRLQEAGCTVAMTGLGSFHITKTFILSLITVIFTFEVVLLQGSPSS